MNGQDILDHFDERLTRLEASGALPAAEAVLRLPSPPLDLHSFTSSYEGNPVLFPASWAPTFSDLSSTLTHLLRDSLQVEVFRLQYKQWDEPWQFEEKTDKTAICKGYTLHPIPISSTETMDFETFMSESSSLYAAHESQLLYLTWRSLPEHSIPSFMPEGFCHFIDTIICPITTPRFIATETIKQRNVWLGSLVTSRIHFDALDNLHVCLSGKKIVHLYPPSDLPNLYPEPWNEVLREVGCKVALHSAPFGSLNNFSQIGSAILANQREHARYFRCKRFRVELNAGEAIFIPAGWWHEVFTLQQTLSINVWFGPSPNAHFRPTLLHLKSDKYLQFMLSRMD